MSSYISSLNLLVDDSPVPMSEEALNEELALWANAQFTFDTKPGSVLPDDSYKTTAEQQELLATLANLNDDTSTQLLCDNVSPSIEQSTGLPRLAPAPQKDFTNLPIQSLNKEPIFLKTTRKRRSSALSKKDEFDEDKRKRNTAASARFRVKKKLKEQELEKTTMAMTLKAEALEKKVAELEKEAKWLRALVVEKDPSLLQ